MSIEILDLKRIIIDLRNENKRLKNTLIFILEECDWEPTMHESGGDGRIGPAIKKALGD